MAANHFFFREQAIDACIRAFTRSYFTSLEYLSQRRYAEKLKIDKENLPDSLWYLELRMWIDDV